MLGGRFLPFSLQLCCSRTLIIDFFHYSLHMLLLIPLICSIAPLMQRRRHLLILCWLFFSWESSTSTVSATAGRLIAPKLNRFLSSTVLICVLISAQCETSGQWIQCCLWTHQPSTSSLDIETMQWILKVINLNWWHQLASCLRLAWPKATLLCLILIFCASILQHSWKSRLRLSWLLPRSFVFVLRELLDFLPHILP